MARWGAEADSRTAPREGQCCVLDMAGTASEFSGSGGSTFSRSQNLQLLKVVLIEIGSVAPLSGGPKHPFASVLRTSYPLADLRPKAASISAASVSRAAQPAETETELGMGGSGRPLFLDCLISHRLPVAVSVGEALCQSLPVEQMFFP